MTGQKCKGLMVVSGRISNVSSKIVIMDILGKKGGREGMATTGVILAAMGLSGPAAGAVMVSSEEMNECVSLVTFEMAGIASTAVLAAWPFNEGDDLLMVGTQGASGRFIALAVLDESKRVVSLYPHLSAGRHAHWTNVLKYSLLAGMALATIVMALLCWSIYALGYSFEGKISPLVVSYLGCVCMVILVGLRVGRHSPNSCVWQRLSSRH